MRSWVPAVGPQFAYLVTHNEAISLADYFTVKKGSKTVYRPTSHYAYHPSNDAVLSLAEMFGAGGKQQSSPAYPRSETEIVDGADQLGVLLYGHKKNAYWYGSTLTIQEARKLAPHQNATGMQVTSAVLAGVIWAIENPKAGIVETEEMDFRRCLEVQSAYLGELAGVYTDWNPLEGHASICSMKSSTSAIPGNFRTSLCDNRPAQRFAGRTHMGLMGLKTLAAGALLLPLLAGTGAGCSQAWHRHDGRTCPAG